MAAIVTPVTSLGFLVEPYDAVCLWQELYRDMTLTTTYKHEVGKLLTILDIWPYSGAYLLYTHINYLCQSVMYA